MKRIWYVEKWKEKHNRWELWDESTMEGRNDLQSGLTILANSPPVNLKAVQREAAALFPGVDTTLIRRSQAFDIQNAGEEFLAVEQVDARDERVRAILYQHRDAAVVQAVGALLGLKVVEGVEVQRRIA
jgi:hypothetical protein